MRSCTCNAPPTVDLTEALLVGGKQRRKDNEQGFKAEPLLRDTLSQYGWCIVSVDLNQIDNESPIKSLEPLKLKQQVQALFAPTFVVSMQKNDAVLYRGRMSESGSGIEEPKQSWEVRRCCHGAATDIPIAYTWTNALHSIAAAVTRVLKLPPNLLLMQDDCHCSSKEEKCNIDLLRVFFYDAVADESSLGSSPHTDWGSWTVVWQDDVGGLQTYCHAHKQWVNVPTPPLEEDRAFFVVHVGDVTSLAMAHASLSDGETIENDNAERSAPVWPSPLHRVLSPTDSVPRASLVYFAYPPPSVSLKDMEQGLALYAKAESQHTAVPYSDYFVLQNQSTSETECSTSPQETYTAIRSRPLGGVFDEKWRQVQR